MFALGFVCGVVFVVVGWLFLSWLQGSRPAPSPVAQVRAIERQTIRAMLRTEAGARRQPTWRR